MRAIVPTSVTECVNGRMQYWRFYSTRDGTCAGPSLGPFGAAADGECRSSGDGTGSDAKYQFITATCDAASGAARSMISGTDHCTCAHPQHMPLCTCQYANGTINEKYRWGSLEECEAACHSD
jgi:hypothetical protein